jgi:parvulin-like peptidyl-prolyl isomerase
MNKSKLVLTFALVFFCRLAFAADDAVLISRSDMTLTASDYEASLAVIPSEKRKQMDPSLKQVMIFLENVMVFRKLAQEGRERGLDKDLVAQQEMRQAADRALAMRRLADFEASLKLPDFSKVAKEQYETKKSDYRVPASVHAEHILVTAKDRSKVEALQRAQEVRAKAVAGADFKALVAEYSDDPSKTNNKGDLGFFEKAVPGKPGGMVKPFEDAAFALQTPGEMSAVVETEFGYHVIRLVEKRAEKQKPFEEVKDGLMQELRSKYITDAKAAHISAIKNDKSIVIHEAAIEALRK